MVAALKQDFGQIMMKASRYNIFFSGKNGFRLVYNTMRGGLLRLTEDQCDEARRILSNPNGPLAEAQGSGELWQTLCEGGFLIEAGMDEITVLKYLDHVKRFDSSTFNLCILPTTTCNFQCKYCYQSLHGYVNDVVPSERYMGERVKEALIKFVEKTTAHIVALNTRWYGGEPLLALDMIMELGESIKSICHTNGCRYTGDMVTNGFLLSRKVLGSLQKINVNRLEISLDGPLSVHDRRRPLKDSKGTFGVILDNIRHAAEVLPTVVVRVNLDQSNLDSAAELFDLLVSQGLQGKVKLKFSNVEGPTEMECHGIYKQSFAQFSNRIVQLSSLAWAKGLDVERVPTLNPIKCPATQANYFIVDPNGQLYKCFQEIGNRVHAVGYLSPDGSFKLNHLIAEWLGWDVFAHADCVKCSILPICMGGCPYNEVVPRIKSPALPRFLRSERCIRWKYNLEDMLLQLA